MTRQEQNEFAEGFNTKVKAAEDRINNELDFLILLKLPPHSFDVLVDFLYNLGANSGWGGNVINYINSGNTDLAMNQMLRCNQVINNETGKYETLEILTIRRYEGVILYNTGIYGPYLEEYGYMSYYPEKLKEYYESLK